MVEATTTDIALAAEHCPVASGTAAQNEIGQDCGECMDACPERGMICDALQRGEGYDLSPSLDVFFSVLSGWECRVKRRVGL